MLFVIDTSTLIVLRKLGWLSLCRLGDNRFFWPPRVTKELKQRKKANKEILDLLASGLANEIGAQKKIKVTDISATDAEVIALAAERDATVFSEDYLLREKAGKLGVPTITLPAFCTLLYQKGLFSKEDCGARLKILYENERLSKSDYRQFLQGLLS